MNGIPVTGIPTCPPNSSRNIAFPELVLVVAEEAPLLVFVVTPSQYADNYQEEYELYVHSEIVIEFKRFDDVSVQKYPDETGNQKSDQ
jgi:hypothetical protein